LIEAGHHRFGLKIAKLKITIVQNLQLHRVHPYNGEMVSVSRSSRNYQWNRVVAGPQELKNFYGLTNILLNGDCTEFQCNEDSADYQLKYKSR
jgi:hypothetical protein